MGSPAVRKLTPACWPGRNPLDHRRAEIACTCSVLLLFATITTNVGRLSLSEPRPYEVHEPRHGRPVIWLPLCMSVIAGSWLIASVCMLRMNTMSSTDFFSHGKSSLIHMPDLPTRSNLYFDGAIGNRAWPLVIVVRRWPMRTDSGKSLSYQSFITGL